MTVYVDSDVIVEIATVLAAVGGLCALVYKAIKWFQQQEQQSADIEKLRAQERQDVQDIRDEQCLLTYGILACLKGLKEQGCNGPVTEAIDKIQKHINQSAHHQQK